MAGITPEKAQAKLDGWLEAEDALMVNQEVSMPGGRKVTRADLGEIRKAIQFWERKVIRLNPGGGIRAMGVTPL